MSTDAINRMNELTVTLRASTARVAVVGIARHGQEHRRRAKRVHDRQQRREHQQHAFEEMSARPWSARGCHGFGRGGRRGEREFLHQRPDAVPRDLHADAQHDERRQPQHDHQPRVAEPLRDAFGVAVGQPDAGRDDDDADDGARDGDQDPGDAVRVVGADRDRDGDGAGIDGQRQRQRIERARDDVDFPRQRPRERPRGCRRSAGASPASRARAPPASCTTGTDRPNRLQDEVAEDQRTQTAARTN